MNNSKKICVFLGAKEGRNPIYHATASLLGLELAKQNCTLIYGGSRNGLMGALADAVLDAGGEVIGVMPTSLPCELQHNQLTELHVVNNMHDRKALMSELADAFVFFPGGIGTFEELFEVWNAKKIGLHNKPLGFLNINGYYNALFNFLKDCSEEYFIPKNCLQQVSIMESPADLIKHMRDKIQQVEFDVVDCQLM